MVSLNIIINSLGRGGAEKSAIALAKDLAKAGLECTVFYIEHEDTCVETNEVKICFLGLIKGKSTPVRLVNYLYAFFQLVLMKRFSDPGAAYLSFLMYSNVINSLSSNSPLLSRTFASERSLILDRVSPSFMGRWLATNYIKVLRRVKKVFAISRPVQDSLSCSGLDNVVVVNNPYYGRASVNSYNVQKNSLDILLVGRLEKIKNFEYVIQQFPRLASFCDSIQVFGDGGQMFSLKRSARETGFGEFITFWGFVDDPYALVKDKKPVTVVSSLSESFGNVVVESLYHGIPVVVSASAKGAVEIVCDGRFGMVYDDNKTSSSLVECLKVLSDPCNYDTYSRLARTRSSDFSRGAWAHKYYRTLFED